MKISIYKKISSSILFLLILSSCTKFVQVDPPSTQLVTASVFNTDGAATSALTSIYTQMNQNAESFNLSQGGGFLSDELTSLSANGNVLPFYRNALLATGSPTDGFWTKYYGYIYQANAVIEGLQKYEGTSIAIKTQLTGEAKFIRAFWYFYLVNEYGDVPLATTTSYAVNAQLARAPKDQVYQQIISDLKEAQNLLNSDFVDASDTTSTTERVRPNKSAATSMLARVYLYTGKYDSAETQATIVISDNKFRLVPDLNNVFLANSTEAIWQLAIPQPSNGLVMTFDGYQFFIVTAPSSGGTNTALVSPWLMSSFELGDLRKVNWIGSRVNGSDTFRFPFKYQVYQPNSIYNPNGRLEYTTVLRLAEQYLIRAEARAMYGNLVGAAEDLNKIRERAGLSDTTASSQTDMLNLILHERRVELFAEWGHRWFDLIRTGNVNNVMGDPTNICYQKGGVWKPESALFPISQKELNNDHNLVQNPGY